MSLDIYLKGKKEMKPQECIECGFIHYHDIQEILYDCNITHNLGIMAKEAGIYEALWRPYKLKEDYNIPDEDYSAQMEFEENNIILAGDIINILEEGLERLEENPHHYKKLDSPNRWGIYDDFLPFVKTYLAKCKEFPQAEIHVSR